MKTTQYVRQLKAIAAADSGGIRERWLYGLRLLHDPEAMSESGKSLKHGVTDQLIATAKAAGLNLSAREIQRCLQCARTYPTGSQIRHAETDFRTWHELANADFPPIEALDGEPPADHRTEAEKARDRARALATIRGVQGELFPLSTFEPIVTTLKDLLDYTDEQEAMTARFVAHGQKRRAYLNDLIEAADGDTSVTWQEAHDRLAAANPDVPDITEVP